MEASKPIVLERSCLYSDRPENHKTAPRQRPVPVEPARHAATSASKTIRLFLSPHLGLRHRSVPLAGEKQEQHTAAITRTQHDRLEGEPRLPLVLSALPNWRVRSLAAGPACCLPAHVSLYDSSSGVPGDHPLVLSEPPRLSRRLQPLRGWSHEEIHQVLPGSPRARRTDGAASIRTSMNPSGQRSAPSPARSAVRLKHCGSGCVRPSVTAASAKG